MPEAESATNEPTRNARLRAIASQASLGVAVVLVAVKLSAWILTGSLSLLTSAVDGLVDTASAFATYFGVRYAARPPNRDHRFGHGKGEAVAGFTQAAFLAGPALALCFQSAERIAFPEPIKQRRGSHRAPGACGNSRRTVG